MHLFLKPLFTVGAHPNTFKLEACGYINDI